MTTRITVAHNEFRLAGTRDALDNGAGNATIELWEGTRPASIEGASGAGTLVSVLTLTKPCGSVAAGILSPTTVSDATAVAAGTPNYALWKDGNGTVVMDTGAGSLVSAEEVKISPATVAAGATVHLVSAALG